MYNHNNKKNKSSIKLSNRRKWKIIHTYNIDLKTILGLQSRWNKKSNTKSDHIHICMYIFELYFM